MKKINKLGKKFGKHDTDLSVLTPCVLGYGGLFFLMLPSVCEICGQPMREQQTKEALFLSVVLIISAGVLSFAAIPYQREKRREKQRKEIEKEKIIEEEKIKEMERTINQNIKRFMKSDQR